MIGSVGCCGVLFSHVSSGDVKYYDVMLLKIGINHIIASASLASNHLDLFHFALLCKQSQLIVALVLVNCSTGFESQ